MGTGLAAIRWQDQAGYPQSAGKLTRQEHAAAAEHAGDKAAAGGTSSKPKY